MGQSNTTPGPFKRARGRAVDPQRTAQTRMAILRAALDTFLEHGFEQTRMADVASRAGLAKGTLYLHFADKEALFEFVLEEVISDPLARLRAVPSPADEPLRASLERLFLPMLRDFEASGRATVLRLIIAEGSRFPALAAVHRRLVIEPFMAVIDELTKRAVAGGQTRLRPLLRFPQLMPAPLIMTSVWNGLWAEGEPIDPAEMFSAFLDLLFGPNDGS